MTLAEFAILVDAPPKWVLNTRALLGSGLRYSLPVAERLAVVRRLNNHLLIPLPKAWTLAARLLEATADAHGDVRLEFGEGLIGLSLDVLHVRAAIAARRSRVATLHAPRRAGRKRRRVTDPLDAAERYGLDLGLMRANLARSPAARLRQLDAMARFRKQAKRRSER